MNITLKYTLGGIAFGFAFPIVSFCFLRFTGNYQSFDLALFHVENPLLYIIDLAPIILGLMAFIIGKKQYLFIQQEQINTENTIKLRTQTLNEKNEFLENEIVERKKLEKRLKKATKEAIQAQKTEQRFLANMSHEIRTPLNSIIGFSRILADSNSKLDNNSKEFLKTIRFASNHLLSVVNDILDMSKVNSGDIMFESKTVDLQSAIKETMNSVQVLSEKKPITLDYELFTKSPVLIKTDVVRLNQVLFNLLSNAIKFTKEGDVKLKIYDTNASSNEENIKLRFEVHDTGIGIKEENFAKVFESFSQAETGTTRKYGGTGLGLSITKKLVELQNGSIGVNSKFGEGSTFWFEIEYEKGDSGEDKIDVTSCSTQNTPEKNINLLIAEDNEMNRFLIKSVFENWSDSCVISFAHNGLEAFELVQSNDFDLVLMDLQMPVKDGFESTEMIRALPAGKGSIPIIALTADVLESVRIKALETGMNKFLTKPINPEELFPAILEHVYDS